MAARMIAASKNTETRIVPYLDIEKYTKASPEFKEAARALNSVRNGGCKCGNPHPQEFYAACGEHLACEACHDDYTMVATRKGLCNYPGCKSGVVWPALPIKAYAIKQQQVAEAIHKLDVALQKEEVKDSQGTHLRDVAMGRAAPASAEEAAGPAGQRGKKRKADYEPEEWAELQQAKKERANERKEVARKAAAYDELLQQHKKLLDLLERNEISISDLKCPADSDFSECSECSDSESDDDEPLAKRAARF
jgi:hypothetical protein